MTLETLMPIRVATWGLCATARMIFPTMVRRMAWSIATQMTMAHARISSS